MRRLKSYLGHHRRLSAQEWAPVLAEHLAGCRQLMMQKTQLHCVGSQSPAIPPVSALILAPAMIEKGVVDTPAWRSCFGSHSSPAYLDHFYLKPHLIVTSVLLLGWKGLG